VSRLPRPDSNEIFRCVAPFAIYRNGVPVVFSDGYEVMGSDPILRTHREHFQPAVERILRRQAVEQATAAPGELRTLPPTTTMREES
jgi:hypothetical protein